MINLGFIGSSLILHVDLQLTGSVAKSLVTGLQIIDSSSQVLNSDSQFLGLNHSTAVLTLFMC